MRSRTHWISWALVLALLCPACKKAEDPGTMAPQKQQEQEDKQEQPAGEDPRPGTDGPAPRPGMEAMQVVPDIAERLAAFAPTLIDYDDSLVTPELKPVLRKLIAAADVMDDLFWIQAWEGNPKLRAELAEAARANAALVPALQYFNVMYGPWDRRKDFEPFVGTQKRPPGAGFYPEDVTKEEIEEHLKKHPEEREAFTGFFTVIRRDSGGKLKAVPYSEHYRDKLAKAATLLREAADLSKDPRLGKYLRARAQAFETNQYRESDMAWMDLGDGALEVVIGPYEVYEDKLFGYKAAFEAFITLRDPVYSDRLAKIAPHVAYLQASLPMKDEDKKLQRSKNVPISVVVQVYTAGDTRAGVQTLAFNLPNDEAVRKEKGYKLVLLKNIAEAKFEKILLPIAKQMMTAEQIPLVTFDAFFTNILTHESAHGLGPGVITVMEGGKPVQMEVGKALKDLYSGIEEAKADIVGLYTAPLLIQKGALPKSLAKQVYASYLAGFFRSVRFGASGAHGLANLLAFNYLREKGGIAFDVGTRKYRVDFDKMPGAVRQLAAVLLELQARGDYAKAKAFIASYGEMSQEMTEALKQLTGVPVDIRPTYAILTKMQSF